MQDIKVVMRRRNIKQMLLRTCKSHRKLSVGVINTNAAGRQNAAREPQSNFLSALISALTTDCVRPLRLEKSTRFSHQVNTQLMFIMDLTSVSFLREVSGVNNLALNIKTDKPKATTYSMNILPPYILGLKGTIFFSFRRLQEGRHYLSVKSQIDKEM